MVTKVIKFFAWCTAAVLLLWSAPLARTEIPLVWVVVLLIALTASLWIFVPALPTVGPATRGALVIASAFFVCAILSRCTFGGVDVKLQLGMWATVLGWLAITVAASHLRPANQPLTLLRTAILSSGAAFGVMFAIASNTFQVESQWAHFGIGLPILNLIPISPSLNTVIGPTIRFFTWGALVGEACLIGVYGLLAVKGNPSP